MQLTTIDRLVLLNILPREGSVTTVKIVRELREELSFSEEEHAALKFVKLDDGGMQWVAEAETEKGVSIGPRAHALIAETLERLDKEKKVTEEYLGVWDKFMDEEREEVSA